MKPYNLKYIKKTNTFGFSDSGRHLIQFNSNELQEVAQFVTRKDISIRVQFVDANSKTIKLKVSLGKTCVWSLDEYGVMKSFNTINSQSQPTYRNMAIEFPLVNGNSIFLWYEKGLAFYGKDRLSAKLINRDEVKFEFTYLK